MKGKYQRKIKWIKNIEKKTLQKWIKNIASVFKDAVSFWTYDECGIIYKIIFIYFYHIIDYILVFTK